MFPRHSFGPGYDPANDTVNGYQALLPATVTDVAVPEPGALVLAGLALLALAGKAARRRR